MRPSVKKSGAACGAEIVFDLARDLDDRDFPRNRVCLSTTTSLSSFAGNSSRIGGMSSSARGSASSKSTSSRNTCSSDFPEILLISNIRDERGEHIGLADAGFTWHTDTSYRRRPSRCSLLYAKEVPHRDGQPLGDTVFANTIAAYEALPETTKKRIDGLKAIHRYSARRRVADSPRPKLTPQQLAETPGHRPPGRPHPPLHRSQVALHNRRRVHRH